MRRGRDWAASLAIQAVLVTLFFAALQHVVVPDDARRPAGRQDTAIVYLVGPAQTPSPPPPRAGSRAPAASAPAAVADAPVDTASAVPVPGFTAAPGVPGPALGDGSLWVTPRPALPAAVADQLYGEPVRRDSVAIARLQAMVDTLNRILDEEQRAHRLPDWTIGGDDGPKWGIDQQWIHLGDIKIPTPVLALLGGMLPQVNNYDEGLRRQQLARMREDLLYSAWRAQTFQDFKRYVRETRERRQRERDEERERRARDTTQVQP